MSYEPITRPGQLPPAGQPFPEHLRFDLKLQVSEQVLSGDHEPEALACDLAAFANARGGVLLVGAREQPAGRLGRYEPMTEEVAGQVRDAFKRAREMCSPQPVIDSRAIAYGDGFVVAVNVDAYAAPPIGVPKGGKSGGDKWWAFPVRRGDDTRNLRPEELATIMDPRARRLALQLQRLIDRADGARGSYQVTIRGTNKSGSYFELFSVDLERGHAVIANSGQPTLRFALPLDAIIAVWMDPKDNQAHMTVRGGVGQDGRSLWQYEPY